MSRHEAREILELLAEDSEARALFAELKNTRGALREFESEIKLPETREFYWSKIQREIQRLEQPKAADVPISIFAAWRRVFVPVSLVVALVITCVLFVAQLEPSPRPNTPAVEALLADSSAMTYRDQETGTTLVWLSYPAQNDFPDTELDDTL